MGRDAVDDWSGKVIGISIHAPRVGRDKASSSIAPEVSYFNPRAPCGARPNKCPIKDHPMPFQSTRPVWGATTIVTDLADGISISIHAPRVGRDSALQNLAVALVISIHAPRVGRDKTCIYVGLRDWIFQSTRPVWGATWHRTRFVDGHLISIHAPRVGRDATERS